MALSLAIDFLEQMKGKVGNSPSSVVVIDDLICGDNTDYLLSNAEVTISISTYPCWKQVVLGFK